jgi:NAD(P)-dependent dehydrogenase (short-subunit alcohol dehydrogenase family)
MAMTGRLEGKIAVVTGAGGGLGAAMSARFAEEGAIVVCQDLDEAAASRSVDAITALGGAASGWACDVSDSTAINSMFEDATTRHGVVDVLVNCAGVDRTPGDGSREGNTGSDVQVTLMSDAGWQRMLDIHLNGAFYCTRAFVDRLVKAEQGGSMICISSIAGLSGWGPVHYATAKAGLLGLVRSVARFCGPLGIRANAICPGVIDTPMSASVSPAMIAGLKMITPLGRIGEPADIAAAAVYLAGDESGFVTGQAISPNGGLVI